MGSAGSAGRSVCYRGPGEDYGTGADARKNDAGFFAGPDSPGRSWGGFGGIRPGASGGRAQVGGGRGLGGRNPSGRGGFVFWVSPFSRWFFCTPGLRWVWAPCRFFCVGEG